MRPLLRTVLSDTVTFEAIAAQKPSHVKESSVVEAIAMPAQTTVK